MIVGSENIELDPLTLLKGRVFLPSNSQIAQNKIEGIGFWSNNTARIASSNVNPFPTDPPETFPSIFMSLYDQDNFLFMENLPVGAFTMDSQNNVFRFVPRFINLSKSYINVLNWPVLDEIYGLVLTFYFSGK